MRRFWTKNRPFNGSWTFFQYLTLAGRDNLPNQKGAQAMRCSQCACKESLKLDYSANQMVP